MSDSKYVNGKNAIRKKYHMVKMSMPDSNDTTKQRILQMFCV